jgi:hypothetical protein
LSDKFQQKNYMYNSYYQRKMFKFGNMLPFSVKNNKSLTNTQINKDDTLFYLAIIVYSTCTTQISENDSSERHYPWEKSRCEERAVNLLVMSLAGWIILGSIILFDAAEMQYT